MESLTIAGYASLFGSLDLALDVVERGAFDRTLRAKPCSEIAMLFQHDARQSIGRWVEATEDDSGLWMRGLIEADHRTGQKVIALVQAGLADGLSIGFRALEATPRPGGGRILKTIDLREVSIVTFPMLPRARLRVREAAPRNNQAPSFQQTAA
ncbi:HK97 family phage prohead protease [Candidatus Phycosocius spiralis]|uniref:Prohead serine protease domain-containing protein n=1 Tax=Candidatus Phycosocius spiralis TaxID=2815099 RepID=A0ABQ4PX08_9PROT|nr:HK97 family phage prohead protease [Candidatus Phycosocius spiralis]GIU67620.1 hypothetical protein PsB1_1774 [Candidatus Phycosocius spiralis]